jgi:flagellar FliL protein
MAANRLESAGLGAEPAKGSGATEVVAAKPAAPPPHAAGRQAWVPAIIMATTMPLLAYGMTTYVLLPKLQHSLAGAPAEAGAKAAATSAAAHSAPNTSGGDSGPREAEAGKVKFYATMNKVLVNVAGTLGTRFLVVNMTLVSRRQNFEQEFRDNEAELRHIAIGSLSSKTINDLERPGAKNLIRSELTSLFNSVLGNGAVQELFFTEFAIQ